MQITDFIGTLSNVQLTALAFATQKHAGQKRRFTGEPYITHPIIVAAIVAEHGGTSEAVMAALLHDVVEDCGATDRELVDLFGHEVAGYVDYLSVPKRQEGDTRTRDERKQEEARRLGGAPPPVHTIKLADMLHNAPSLVAHDLKFAKVWLHEAVYRMPYLAKGHPALLSKVWGELQAYKAAGLY